MKDFNDLKAFYHIHDSKRRVQFGKVNAATDKGLYIPSSLVHMHKAFLHIKNMVDISKPFLDAGSGDGRIVALAAQHGFLSFGIEYDKEHALLSQQYTEHLERKKTIPPVKIVQGDFVDDYMYDKLGIPFHLFGTIFNFANSCYEITSKIIQESPEDTYFLFYDTAQRPTVFQGLQLVKTLTLVDWDAKEEDFEKDLPLLVNYLHIYKK